VAQFGNTIILILVQDPSKGHGAKKEDPAYSLMKLYAHKPEAIKELQKCRINPDFTSSFRTDLEFYIPQYCSFYLNGLYDD